MPYEEALQHPDCDFNEYVGKLTERHLTLVRQYNQGRLDPNSAPIVAAWIKRLSFQVQNGLPPPDAPSVRAVAAPTGSGAASTVSGAASTGSGKGAKGKGGYTRPAFSTPVYQPGHQPGYQPGPRPPPPSGRGTAFEAKGKGVEPPPPRRSPPPPARSPPRARPPAPAPAPAPAPTAAPGQRRKRQGVPTHLRVDAPERLTGAAGMYELQAADPPKWKLQGHNMFIRASADGYWELANEERGGAVRSEEPHERKRLPDQVRWPQPPGGGQQLTITDPALQSDGWDAWEAGAGGQPASRAAAHSVDDDDEVVEVGPNGPAEPPKEEDEGPSWRCHDCSASVPLDVDVCPECGCSRRFAMEDPRSQTAERRIDEADGNAYTKKEFDEYWGEMANEKWAASVTVGYGATARHIREVKSGQFAEALEDVKMQPEYKCEGCGKVRILGEYGDDGRPAEKHRVRCQGCGGAWAIYKLKDESKNTFKATTMNRREWDPKSRVAEVGGSVYSFGQNVQTNFVPRPVAPTGPSGQQSGGDDGWGDHMEPEEGEERQKLSDWSNADVCKWAAIHQLGEGDLQTLQKSGKAGRWMLSASEDDLKAIGFERLMARRLLLRERDAQAKRDGLWPLPEPEPEAPEPVQESAAAGGEEQRVDTDGCPYTLAEFVAEYGDEAQERWARAPVARAAAPAAPADDWGDDDDGGGDGWVAAPAKPAKPASPEPGTVGGDDGWADGGGGGGAADDDDW